MSEEMKKAIAYVKENKIWTDAEELRAIERIENFRCSIDYADETIANDIADLMEEYSAENDLPEGWWEEEMSVDDIFVKL